MHPVLFYTADNESLFFKQLQAFRVLCAYIAKQLMQVEGIETIKIIVRVDGEDTDDESEFTLTASECLPLKMVAVPLFDVYMIWAGEASVVDRREENFMSIANNLKMVVRADFWAMNNPLGSTDRSTARRKIEGECTEYDTEDYIIMLDDSIDSCQQNGNFIYTSPDLEYSTTDSTNAELMDDFCQIDTLTENVELTPATVQITSPANNSAVSSPVRVNFIADDNEDERL